MMDLHAIQELNREATNKAKRKGSRPLVPTAEQRVALAGGERPKGFYVPNMGNYIPKGWKLVDQLFVDKSGWGGEHEPAMTQTEFLRTAGNADPTYGFGMIEEGQFQCYVGVFAPTRKAK